MSTKMVTPELNKLKTVEWKAINGFLEFLSEKQVWLARVYEFGEEGFKYSRMDGIGVTEKLKLTHEYFGTTPEACEAERQEMLRRIRYGIDKEEPT